MLTEQNGKKKNPECTKLLKMNIKSLDVRALKVPTIKVASTQNK